MTSTVHPQSNGSIGFGVSTGALIGTLLSRLASTPRVWWQRHVARQQLMELDDRMLRDIGLSRADAAHEWQKAFWEI
ncbi:MAG TPA: DUF1127 domain-containing protein [bacterium]|jgi:uncharacterized protein YjiS (DUF1127 family)